MKKRSRVKSYSNNRLARNYMRPLSGPAKAIIFLIILVLLLILSLVVLSWVI